MSFRRWLLALTLAAVAVGAGAPFGALAQDKGRARPRTGGNAADVSSAEKKALDALAAPADAAPQTAPPPAAAEPSPPPNLFSLWWQGGALMYPITAMSVIVAIFALERLLALRKGKVIPGDLVDGLGQLAGQAGGIDPRQAYKLCQQHPSTASSVFRAVLLKVGRPHSELEHTVTESCEREAARLYKNVRPIALAVSVTPLLGLLGTVQGMIECFYRTANLPVGANRTEALAEGIYIALLTTFGGLVVAIPAAVISHYFEGAIQSRFHEIDELVQGLLPQLERFEGKLRVNRGSLATEGAPPVAESPVAEPVGSKPERVRG